MGRTSLFALVAAVAAALACGTARADGLPVVGVDGGMNGVLDSNAGIRYLALGAGKRTLVVKIEQNGGRMLGSRLLAGAYAVPLVAFDLSAGGLSADGRTLVLIRPRLRFPRKQTGLAVLDARRLRLREELILRGDFSFDAVSPDGRLLYLIQYLSPTDPNRYAVRLYDLVAGRLEPKPIVDPDEATEPMRGYPVTRATSPDGRWEYTLYDGAGLHPFVHALDTVGRTAVCIDLDDLAGRTDLYDLKLKVADDGSTFDVQAGGNALFVVDTRTFAVAPPTVEAPPSESPTGAPAAPAPAEPASPAGPQSEHEGDGGVPWALVGAATGAFVALGAIGAAALRRRRLVLG